MQFVNLYEAKTRLSALVEQAAAGEEIIIAKNGVARARLVPIAARATPRSPPTRCTSVVSPTISTRPDPAIARLFAGEDP